MVCAQIGKGRTKFSSWDESNAQTADLQQHVLSLPSAMTGQLKLLGGCAQATGHA